MKLKLTVLLALACIACWASSAHAQALNVLPLPPRQAGALTGSQFYSLITTMTQTQWEQNIYNQAASGNVPNFMRSLKPVTVTRTVSGTPRTVTYYTTPDYFCIGSDADFFRVPMTPTLAQHLANLTQCTLPTRRMVDDIWTSAAQKFEPITYDPATTSINSLPVIYQHQLAIQAQRGATPLGPLAGGYKKDVVISPVIPTRPPPARVCIYGWYRLSGSPWQPLSTIHENTYWDYSHGARLTRNRILVDNVETSFSTVLADPALNVLVTDEGANNYTAYPISSAPPSFPYADNFPSTGRQLAWWINRFTIPTVQPYSPTSPGGDGFALIVRDTSGGVDTTRLGFASDNSYFVEADIYCRYRPEVAADGFERVGIFLRDDGQGMFDGVSGSGLLKGNNYALSYDSADGRIRCLRNVNGVPTDLLATPLTHTVSAWRKMRIEAAGNTIVYKLDGTLLLSVSDNTRAAGEFGIGYREAFTTNANIAGTVADNFRAGLLAGAGTPHWRLY